MRWLGRYIDRQRDRGQKDRWIDKQSHTGGGTILAHSRDCLGNRKKLELAQTILWPLRPFKGEWNTRFLSALELGNRFLFIETQEPCVFSGGPQCSALTAHSLILCLPRSLSQDSREPARVTHACDFEEEIQSSCFFYRKPAVLFRSWVDNAWKT